MPSNEVLELTPGQVVNVLATKQLVVRVKVRGYGRGRLTVAAVGPGGLFASASKSGPEACDWTAGRTAIGWRVVIEPQWWVHASDFCFVRFGLAGPSPVSSKRHRSDRHSPAIPAQLPPATRPRRTIWERRSSRWRRNRRETYPWPWHTSRRSLRCRRTSEGRIAHGIKP